MPQARARAPRADDERRAPRPRRTVTITGHPGDRTRADARVVDIDTRRSDRQASRGPRAVEIQRRRPARRASERVGTRPDRVALWALLLALFLIFVAATSSRADAASDRSSAGATPTVLVQSATVAGRAAFAVAPPPQRH